YPVICVTVCGNENPTGILKEHPDWALRHPDGTPLGYISPAHPEARQWLASVADEIVRKYQPDGIMLDYIRYHNRPLLLDPAADQRFHASLPEGTTPEQEKQLMQQFKEDELTELVRLYSETVRTAHNGTRLGIYSWGPHVAENHQIAQCWPRWVQEGYLDLVNVSGYYHHDKYGEKYLPMFEQKMRSAVELNRGTGRPVPLSFALGVETSHGRVHSADDIRIYLNRAAEAELDGFVAFTWNTLLPYLDELDQTGDIRTFPNH
ncbi:MAG: family 10 glycosylhydrolase, partial [Planctomycetaceae bacterium]|nr:family 10 glycosylhydrolase [Planctomycetaceae bacterium]